VRVSTKNIEIFLIAGVERNGPMLRRILPHRLHEIGAAFFLRTDTIGRVISKSSP
jgi:hypothetical protein